mmetsp:Transcript_67604/g.170607  ORF Transcript_67604/g.170607 Transcript_67604/m.170607 type:complete len:305 (-) Transcript_67604:52-966(-)
MSHARMRGMVKASYNKRSILIKSNMVLLQESGFHAMQPATVWRKGVSSLSSRPTKPTCDFTMAAVFFLSDSVEPTLPVINSRKSAISQVWAYSASPSGPRRLFKFFHVGTSPTDVSSDSGERFNSIIHLPSAVSTLAKELKDHRVDGNASQVTRLFLCGGAGGTGGGTSSEVSWNSCTTSSLPLLTSTAGPLLVTKVFSKRRCNRSSFITSWCCVANCAANWPLVRKPVTLPWKFVSLPNTLRSLIRGCVPDCMLSTDPLINGQLVSPGNIKTSYRRLRPSADREQLPRDGCPARRGAPLCGLS